MTFLKKNTQDVLQQKVKKCIMNTKTLTCYAIGTTAQMQISTWELLYNRFESIQPKIIVGLLFQLGYD